MFKKYPIFRTWDLGEEVFRVQAAAALEESRPGFRPETLLRAESRLTAAKS
jgi:hypothetical protein